MNIDFIPGPQLEQYLKLYNVGLDKFKERCNFLEIDGTNYIKTYMGSRMDKLSEEDKTQLLKYFVWWRIYADLNLEEGEHYKSNFDKLLRACRESRNNGKEPRKIMVI